MVSFSQEGISQVMQGQKQGSKLRTIMISVVFIFLCVLAITLILNALGILAIKSSWSTAVGIVFTVLATIFAFGQWVLPLSKAQSEISNTSPAQLTTSTTSNEDYDSFRKQIEYTLKNKIKDDKYGHHNETAGLIIFASKSHVGQQINLIDKPSWDTYDNIRDKLSGTKTTIISPRRINEHTIYVATFQELSPANYVVWTNLLNPRPIALFDGEVAELDLPDDSKLPLDKQIVNFYHNRKSVLTRSAIIIGILIFGILVYSLIPKFYTRLEVSPHHFDNVSSQCSHQNNVSYSYQADGQTYSYTGDAWQCTVMLVNNSFSYIDWSVSSAYTSNLTDSKPVTTIPMSGIVLAGDFEKVYILIPNLHLSNGTISFMGNSNLIADVSWDPI